MKPPELSREQIPRACLCIQVLLTGSAQSSRNKGKVRERMKELAGKSLKDYQVRKIASVFRSFSLISKGNSSKKTANDVFGRLE